MIKLSQPLSTELAADPDDDRVNAASIVLTTKQMVILAARTPSSVFSGIGFKVDTPMTSGQGGDYKVFFGLGGV